ncbi:unnamed protein product [Lymnaea stagnalis]|uniref:Uncharacterized protein n=1 Tax=Lymnaea stagnalis TaxID=6523 RepID=A0AAV2HYE0_LYMST
MVLQYYDYSVERAIQAYLEDGAKGALQEWNFTGTKPLRSHHRKGRKQLFFFFFFFIKKKIFFFCFFFFFFLNPMSGAHMSDVVSPVDLTSAAQKSSQEGTQAATASSVTSAAPEAKGSSNADPTVPEALPQRQSHKGRGHVDRQHQLRARERTVSEVSTGSGMGDGHNKKPFQGLEKAIKDLHRQTTSLERLKLVLDHEIDRSYKSMKSVFEELRQGYMQIYLIQSKLPQFFVLAISENTVFKIIISFHARVNYFKFDSFACSEMLEMRQGKAVDLRRQVDRADRLKEAEVSDLRAEIKHFVSERRHDEELGRATRFLFDSDHMLDEMKKFGEVVHVKSVYTARRASVASVASSSVSHDDDTSHSQEVSQLQDRLKNSLKLPYSSSHGSSSSPRPSSTPSDPHNTDFTPSKNNRRRPPNTREGTADSYRGGNSVSTSLDVNSNKATTLTSAEAATPYNSNLRGTNSPKDPSTTYRNGNTSFPGRGGRGGSSGYGPRTGSGGGRGRGLGRGSGRGGFRGRGGYGGDSSRPQSTQGQSYYRTPSATAST